MSQTWCSASIDAICHLCSKAWEWHSTSSFQFLLGNPCFSTVAWLKKQNHTYTVHYCWGTKNLLDCLPAEHCFFNSCIDMGRPRFWKEQCRYAHIALAYIADNWNRLCLLWTDLAHTGPDGDLWAMPLSLMMEARFIHHRRNRSDRQHALASGRLYPFSKRTTQRANIQTSWAVAPPPGAEVLALGTDQIAWCASAFEDGVPSQVCCNSLWDLATKEL